MYRKFIATITAASIALTALGTAPAFAGDQQTARTIAAILGLAAVGAIIHENRRDREEADIHRERQAPIYRPSHPVKREPRYDPPRYDPPRYSVPKPRPLPQRVDRRLLPQECFRSFETRRGQVRMFGSRCLDRYYGYANRLPHECEYVFRTRDGERRGYEARCLRDRGYRLARG